MVFAFKATYFSSLIRTPVRRLNVGELVRKTSNLGRDDVAIFDRSSVFVCIVSVLLDRCGSVR
jgi:hypothetical protein